MLEILASKNATIHSFTTQQISSILDQTMKGIDRFKRDAKNRKKKLEKLKKELERCKTRDSLQGQEITALNKLANVSLSDELVRKVIKRELKREQKRKRAIIVEYFSSTDSGSKNEKPRKKNRKMKAKKKVVSVPKPRVKTKKDKKKSLGKRENKKRGE